MKKHTRAFTLLELIAALIIVGVLVSVVVPRITSYTKQAREKACRGNIATINEQVELYYVRIGEWPRGDLVDIGRDPNWFPNLIPDCPVTGYNYWIYEDTHRVGGHIEGDPESHKELGISKFGEAIVDSQAQLLAGLGRGFQGFLKEVSGNFELVRYTDIIYGADGDITSLVISLYDAYGNIVGTLLASNAVWENETTLQSVTYDFKNLYENRALSLNMEFEAGDLVNVEGAFYYEDQSVRAYVVSDGVIEHANGLPTDQTLLWSNVKKMTLRFTDAAPNLEDRKTLEYLEFERHYVGSTQVATRVEYQDGEGQAKETYLNFGWNYYDDDKIKQHANYVFDGAINTDVAALPGKTWIETVA